MQRLELLPADDIVSICDQLDWVNERRVLLVLPNDGRVLDNQVDLARLRRKADGLRLEIGLVTLDPQLILMARSLGFPTFANDWQAERDERLWRRGRRRREKAGLAPDEIRRTFLAHIDRQEVERRKAARPVWQTWVWRYLTIPIFFFALALVYLGIVYSVPGATITIRPYVEPVAVTQMVVADPQLAAVNFGGASIPARVLLVQATWQTEVATTGTINVPDTQARGKVLFVNLVDLPVTIPAGTEVATSGSGRIVFQTVQPVQAAGLVGATAEADVIAVDPGPRGNVEANQINQISGALASQLEVRNIEPLTGGDVRQAPAVSQADIDRLRTQVVQYLQTLAQGQMEAQLEENEFLARESLQVSEILQETRSHAIGERADTVALEIRAEIRATAVDTNQANDLVYSQLIGTVRSGYTLVPDSFNFYSDGVSAVDGEGRVNFSMVGEGIIAAQLDLAPHLSEIAGQETDLAMRYLYEQLPLEVFPEARVLPDWFGRLPYLPARIQVEVDDS